MKITFISVILALIGLVPVASTLVYAQELFEEYNSDLLEVSFQYPQGWENVITEEKLTTGTEGNRISFDLPFTKEGVFVILEEETELDKLSQLEMEELKGLVNLGFSEISEYDIIEVVPTTLDNHNATKLRYDNKYDVQSNSILQIISLIDGKEYHITYRTDSDSFNKYLPTVEKMIQSIKIKE